jgi:hypothetical protein
MSALQLFDALSPAIEDALRASIRRFGVIVPVVKDQHGRIVDGHHRSRIAGELGVDFTVQQVTVADEDEAREIARTLNSDRRHLTEEQRRPVVVELRQQGHSYRAIGGALGVSHTQARADVEAARLEGAFQSEPERIVRLGGGSYPATRPAAVEPEPDAIDDVPLPFDEPEPEGVGFADTPAEPVLTPEQKRANAEFVAAVRESAERQQQEVLEMLAKQEAVNAFGRASDGLLSAVSYAAAFRPPAEIPAERIDQFIARTERLLETARTWKEQTA